MSELASMTLSQPLLVGSNPVEFGGDITDYCWPTYKRETRAVGGDWVASFQFSADDSILERWFDNYLACHFEESWGGITTFMGLVWSMRLAYNGLVLTKSMDELANRISVRYQTDSAAAKGVTSTAIDADSEAYYGAWRFNEEAPVFMNATTADAYRDNLLDQLAWPRVQQESVQLGGARQPGVLQVEIRGYVHTMNGRLLLETSTALDDLSDEIDLAVTGSDYVTKGAIEANTLQVNEETDYEGRWDRIKKLVALGSSGGSVWKAGCFQGREFTYSQADVSTIFYEQEVRTARRLTFGPGTGHHLPAPLVQPGHVMFVRDIMGGRPQSATLLDDPRAMYVQAVEYNAEGVVLKGKPGSEGQKAAALGIALRQKRGRRRSGGGTPVRVSRGQGPR